MDGNLNNKEYYQIITGYITDFEVFDSKRYFLKSRESLGLPSIDLSEIGELELVRYDIRKEIHSLQRNSKIVIHDIVEYFRCKLGDNLIEGVFALISFKEGDYVEMVVEPLPGGSYFAFAVRRAIDHRLWLHPHATSGTQALNKYMKNKSSAIYGTFFITSLLGVVLLVYSLMRMISEKLSFFIILYIFLLILGLFLVFCGYSLISMRKNRSRSGSKVADKIFATLGYPNPKEIMVDLKTDNNKYDFYKLTSLYFSNTKGRNKVKGALWLALYTNAPAIPSYINVIHTENNQEKRTGN